MIIEIKRFSRERTRTLGNLYINGDFICNTLEEADRHFPQKCNNAFYTQRRMKAVCSHVINRGESCSIQGTFKLGFVKYPNYRRELLALLNEPHHKYNKIYLTGIKHLTYNIYSLIQIGFYDKEKDEFKMDHRLCYYKIELRIKNAIKREEDVLIRINYNDV